MTADLRKALEQIAEFCSSDARSLGAVARLGAVQGIARAALAQSRPETAGADEGKAKAALAYLIEKIEYSDSYGVQGSDFMCCHLCSGGGAPGIKFEHDADCPVMRCEAIAAEWWDELQADRADIAPAVSPQERSIASEGK